MKLVESEALKHLPAQVKALVRSGVYSLYTTNHPNGEFVLVTDKNDVYLVGADGQVTRGEFKPEEVGEVVGFAGTSLDLGVVTADWG